MVPDDLILLTLRERQREADRERLGRVAACFRTCRAPTRLDRLARVLHLAPTTC